MAAPSPRDERSNLEKLDDLQAAHPFAYNLLAGLLMGMVLLLIGFHPVTVPIYALSYATLRWFLWQPGRLLHRQYDARSVRWRQKQAARRRNRA
jgi:hypothetical protein